MKHYGGFEALSYLQTNKLASQIQRCQWKTQDTWVRDKECYASESLAWVSYPHQFRLPCPQFSWGDVEYPSWKVYAQWGWEKTCSTFSWREAVFLLSWSEDKRLFLLQKEILYLCSKDICYANTLEIIWNTNCQCCFTRLSEKQEIYWELFLNRNIRYTFVPTNNTYYFLLQILYVLHLQNTEINTEPIRHILRPEILIFIFV